MIALSRVGLDCTLSNSYLSPPPYQSLKSVAVKPCKPADCLKLQDYYPSVLITLNAKVLPWNAWYL